MELDVIDVSIARCYNCNKTGHLSKDCSAPRKIKYKNPPSKLNLNLMEIDPPHIQDARSFVKDLFDFLEADSPAHSSADSYAYSALSKDFIGNLAGQIYDSGHLTTESNDELDRIGDEIDILPKDPGRRLLE
ncbi:hypothetical protein MJO28_013924 [Puccinia striiformis f. sp. tritici]|uniref:Uncharacterized protein n=1 Tax=Puccinia striiformis f. sp. tritici TaxID=168172 RepID=A0ACC0DYP3_9BASI|nr:hypothetical protein MJO28_013924 [Puccinia striiformis f. sp. tritici]KAI7941698.1 hypothetical protein MJO29_013772 [Puccinia striiformis f. sp. tritici]